MEHYDQLYDLFESYIHNTCSAEDIKNLCIYFETGEDEEALRYLIQNELQKRELPGLTEVQVEAATLQVWRAINYTITEPVKRSYKLKVSTIWSLLAAVALVMIVPALVFISNRKVPANPFVDLQFKSVTTLRGQRKLIHLTDGSSVWLAPVSSLSYPNAFKGNTREVRLVGEAFFEISKDKHHPFIIHSGKIDTKVVGTSFLIRADPDATQADVTVITGIVKVSTQTLSKNLQENVTVTPNQRAVFGKLSGSLTSMEFPDANTILKRKEGVLVYHDATVKGIVEDLSRYYNTRILLDSKSSNCTCSGEFDINKAPATTLEQLVTAIGGKVTQINGAYRITGGCD